MKSQMQIAESLSKILPSDWFFTAPKINHQVALDRALQDGFYATCEHLHDNSCEAHNLVKVINIMKASSKMYFLVHLIPVLIFKRKQLRKQPVHTIAKMLFGWIKSVSFVCIYALISRIGYCKLTNDHKFNRNIFIVLITIAQAGIFLEARGRAMEIAMYVTPKYLETLPVFLGKMHLWPNIPLGINLITALSFGILANCYFTESQCIKSYLRTVLRGILGKANEEVKGLDTTQIQKPCKDVESIEKLEKN